MNFKTNTKGLFAGTLLLASALMASTQAQATTIDFGETTGGFTFAPSFVFTQEGVSATFSNFSTGATAQNSTSICVVGTPSSFCDNLTSFDLTFSEDVQLISFVTGFSSFNEPGESVVLTFTQGSNCLLYTSPSPRDRG